MQSNRRFIFVSLNSAVDFQAIFPSVNETLAPQMGITVISIVFILIHSCFYATFQPMREYFNAASF